MLRKCGFREGAEQEVDAVMNGYEPADLSAEQVEELKRAVSEMNVDMREGQFERPPQAPKKVKLLVYVITRDDVLGKP